MSDSRQPHSNKIGLLDYAKPVPAARPLGDFSWERIDGDLVLFDAEKIQYHTLNWVAQGIWQSCDGVANFEVIATVTGLPVEVVETTIAELGEASLLQSPASTWSVSISRRRAAKVIAVGAVGAVGIPVVLSLTAPTALAQTTPQSCPYGVCSCTGTGYIYCVNQAGKRQCVGGSVDCGPKGSWQ